MSSRLNTTFRALQHRDYRYYWTGQSISQLGTAMQSAALAWLVYTLTGSPLLLGTLAFFQYGPLIVLALPAGVFVDRWPKRRLLVLTQVVFMLQALALAVLVFSGRATYQLILFLASIYGITQAFDNPGRRSFLVDMVGKEDLMNAVSLNSTAFNVSRIVGPSIAGIIMAKFGGGWCFLLNAVSYLTAIAGLLMISEEGRPALSGARKQIAGELAEGLSYLWKSDALRLPILMVATLGVFGLNYNVLVPVFADRVLHMGPQAYGVLLSSIGLGALIGAVVGASAGHRWIAGRVILQSAVVVGAVQIAMACTATPWISSALLIVFGAASMCFANAASTAVQSNVDPRLRGRVMSVYTLVDVGTMPPGNWLAGVAISGLGASIGFGVFGAATLAVLTLILVAERKSISQSIMPIRQ